MQVRAILRKHLTLNRIALLLLFLLFGLFCLKLGARVENKRNKLKALSPVEETMHGIIEGVLLNPKSIWQFLTAAKPQPKVAEGVTHMVGQDPIPLDKKYLYARFDQEQEAFVINLLRLSDNTVLHRWKIGFDKLAEHFMPYRELHANKPTFENYLKAMYKKRLISPLLLGDRHLLLMYQTMLLHLDAESNVVWQHDKLFHHSIELDADSNAWLCSAYDAPPDSARYYRGDQIVKLDPATGEVLFQKRIEAIFKANPAHNLSNMNQFHTDPYHLNDVQPVLSDGPFWQKGDVFVSLRNINCVFLYRPATNEILWRKLTGWYLQHDVNILTDSTISVFNNNWDMQPPNRNEIPGFNEFVTYNFASGATHKRFKDIYRRYNVDAHHQGRGRLFPQDSVLFTEDTPGGFIILSDLRADTTYKCAIPGWSAGKAAHLGWYRVMD